MTRKNSGIKVSIILPVYNVEKWIIDAAKSIQEQSLTEWEAIFVIDGSKDKSKDYITLFAAKDNRFKIFCQPNLGIAAARNRGVEESKGKYIFFMDPDDLITPNALEVCYQKAEKVNADIIVGDYFQFKDGSEIILETKKAGKFFNENFSKIKREIFYRSDIKDDHFFYHSLYFMVVWMKLFRRETWLKNKISAPSGLSMGEDSITVRKMCFLNSRISTVDAVLIFYRKRRNSATTKRSIKSFAIFNSFNFNLNMYKDLNLSRKEISLMCCSFFDLFNSHLFFFTPYLKMYDFYKRIKVNIKFLKNNIQYNHLNEKNINAFKAFYLPSIFGFFAYILILKLGVPFQLKINDDIKLSYQSKNYSLKNSKFKSFSIIKFLIVSIIYKIKIILLVSIYKLGMVIFNFLNENLPIPYKRFFIFIIKGIQKFLNNKNKISKLLDKIIYKIELTQD